MLPTALHPIRAARVHCRMHRRTVCGALLAALFAVAPGCTSQVMKPDPTLPNAVSGERREFSGRLGPLSYYVSGPAGAATPPLLLIHSVNAAASAYEVRPLYEHYRPAHRLCDGSAGLRFLRSQRPRLHIRLMTDAVHADVEEIRQRQGPGPIDAFALSLSSEFLARAASEAPERFRTLALVSPPVSSKRAPSASPGQQSRQGLALRRFHVPLWSRGFYDLLTSRRGVRFFLGKTWGANDIDEGLLEYDC